MSNTLKPDICIIGGGSGGLSVAAGAVQMGASVVLIEKNKMGGDCLNDGCIPSKSLLAAAKAAQNFRISEKFGITAVEPRIHFQKVMQHVQSVIESLRSHDSQERFEKLGVTVIKELGYFHDQRAVIAGKTQIKARRIVIATGSSPAIPPIPGLDKVPFYTNETIFNLKQKPDHLIVIGGGPIGCELGQAFSLLGIKVTILESKHILPHDDPDFVEILRTELKQTLSLHENINISECLKQNNQIEIRFTRNNQNISITGSDILIATGRNPELQHLNLEAAKIKFGPKGINVDASLRTTNKNVYAIGDIIGGYQFTHIANYHAGIVIRNILFRLPAKVDYRAIPWVTYTLPELAHVGLTNDEIKQQDPNAKEITLDFNQNDRAHTEHQTIGKIKITISRKAQILAVTILCPSAGELLLPWIYAIQHNKSIKSMTDVIVPYPTLSEISKSVAGEYYKPKLFSKTVQKIVHFLRILG
jgi:pyruvate/2-oxoglutarate dehydrogenase complex dihydrolipoamide dehydrogenase (E3) component